MVSRLGEAQLDFVYSFESEQIQGMYNSEWS